MKFIYNGEILSGGAVYPDSIPTVHKTLSEYKALSYEEKQANVVYLISYDNTESGEGSVPTPSEDIYSSEETRIGRWIDGKPLYRKVFEGLLGNALEDVSIGMIEDAEQIARMSANYTNSNGDVVLSGEGIIVFFRTINKTVYIRGEDSNDKSKKVTAIFEYTKTTDTSTISTISEKSALNNTEFQFTTTTSTTALE